MAQAAPAKLFAARQVKLFTIGQVLDVLSQKFPDLSPSKLRFLEEQGLVTPQRTASGYRKFTELDIERIQIILELQRDQYLPLKVIRSYLADLDEGKQPSLPGGTVNTQHLRQARGKKLTRIELIAETAITDQLIAEAQDVSLLTEEPFDASALEIARAIVHLQRFGIQPRHLRGIKASAEREIGIIEGVVAPVLGKNDTASRSRAAHYAAEIENQFSAIRTELIRSVISKIDG
ncbi:MerR family transcriptional regulator [Rhodoluna sp.]|uniref:transcriptional regulator FtsR n=1 Tax=Rhodoluna sp. TaxID=1969481 RepID=UPI0025F34D74|nr:MerR family transcriptional regulator [Rhodoluna sp.]